MSALSHRTVTTTPDSISRATRSDVATALEVAREIESGVVVTILCDGADKYLSESFWED